jgi:hypothetical protein
MRRQPDFEETVRVEVRWFLPGDVGRDVVAGRQPDKRRVDSYHVGSLSESSAWKRRGRRGPFEWKHREGPPLPITMGGVNGVAERWVKLRTRTQPELVGPWIDVDKQFWLTGDWQVCRLQVDGIRSWTIALQRDESFPDLTMSPKLERWWPLLRVAAIAASYPAWLIAHHPGALPDRAADGGGALAHEFA